jgi:hypothetical protein
MLMPVCVKLNLRLSLVLDLQQLPLERGYFQETLFSDGLLLLELVLSLSLSLSLARSLCL